MREKLVKNVFVKKFIFLMIMPHNQCDQSKVRERKCNLRLGYYFTALFFFFLPICPLFLNEIPHYFHGSFYSAEKRAKLYNIQFFCIKNNESDIRILLWEVT